MNNADRTQLRRIVQGGATPRILDLWSIRRRFGNFSAHISKPFFRNPRLNSSFFIKHTVRPQERPYLRSDYPIATKILIPVNIDDLSMGGHAFFVQERGFEPRLREFLGAGTGNKQYEADLERLKELSNLPSFDPFLLADRYAKGPSPVARLYFNITQADQAAMLQHVAEQMAGIVGLAFGAEELVENDARAMKFAEQLLDDDETGNMEQLRATLGLRAEEFAGGIFGWKGILYYRWNIDAAKNDLREFVIEMNDLIVHGATQRENEQINSIRRSILDEVRSRWAVLTEIMDQYEHELSRFCLGGDPSAIRRFMLHAPRYFNDLGSDLSAVTHVTSFWKYWWTGREKGSLQARHAMEIFPGFLRSLTRDADTEESYLVA